MVVPDILANSGGVIVSCLEWVQNLNRTHWPESQVNEELERKMALAFKGMYEKTQKLGVSMRNGALALAIQRVADAIRTLGMWP